MGYQRRQVADRAGHARNALALAILGGFHAYLVLTNQTTIEFQLNMLRFKEGRKRGEYFRNPYDLGRSRNFQEVFGPNPFWRLRWMLSWLASLARPSWTRCCRRCRARTAMTRTRISSPGAGSAVGHLH